MGNMKKQQQGTVISVDLRPLLRIAGSFVGLLVVGVLLGWLLFNHFYPPDNRGDVDQDNFALFIYGGLGFLIGGTIGAAGGATVVQKILRQRSSFWKALLGAVVGLLIGIPIVLTVYGIPLVPVVVVAGAVIGSRGKDEPVSSSGMQGVISPDDTLKLQPGQAKCPFCHSTTFRIEEEAGSRRCSECHSVLPNYIHGNR
jgi:hypothetical protein